MRTYTTQSGTFTEDELAVVIWRNPKTKTSRQSRSLETMTSENSSLPMAFPIKALSRNKSWQQATIVRDKDALYARIADTERSKPLIVPLPVAKAALGWEDFYIPTEYDI